MTNPAKQPETPLEPHPVWDLVDKAPTQPASAHFAIKTVQLVRAYDQRQSLWQRLMARPTTSVTGLLAAAAAIALVIGINFPGEKPDTLVDSHAGFVKDKAAAIQEALETEMLIAAADNPANFSDQELVYLIGF